MHVMRLFLVAALTYGSTTLLAGEGITFTNAADDLGVGIDYRRVRSERDAIYEEIRNMANPPGGLFARVPTKARGNPGVAIFDFDNDGDLDVYVTNGPNVNNSLYANQLVETGEFSFIDVSEQAGAGVRWQDSGGVAYGDIDNDGDHDLYVLGCGENNALLQNNGDGTFTDITEQARLAAGEYWSSSASFGDVNGDGLLDLFIGNIGNLNSSEILFTEPFKYNEHNQLFINAGNNVFIDVSETSGVQNLGGLAPEHDGLAGPTHAVAMVDIDLDGDIDIMTADDQAGITPARWGGLDRGMIHMFINDGTGQFTDQNVAMNVADAGAWMGLAFGDFNHDGRLDFFASNMGIYNGAPPELMERNLEQNASRWYFGGDNGFTRPELGAVGPTPFGWGTAGFDYDNDGDSDIVFYGGLDMVGMIMLSNPGALLRNDGDGVFSYDRVALADSADHSRRVIHGLAIGDLNEDGFLDIVSASNFDIPQSVPLTPFPSMGGAFDDETFFVQTFGVYDESFRYDPNLPDFPDGTLTVELNSADNGGAWAQVELMGAKGLHPYAKVNRDAIGAVVTFRPYGGKSVMQPILGGASYASQDALTAHFGLGEARRGVAEVLWPGGVKTVMYNVQAGERVKIPELPVSYDTTELSLSAYTGLIEDYLDGLVEQEVLTTAEARRVRNSAKWGYILNRGIVY